MQNRYSLKRVKIQVAGRRSILYRDNDMGILQRTVVEDFTADRVKGNCLHARTHWWNTICSHFF